MSGWVWLSPVVAIVLIAATGFVLGPLGAAAVTALAVAVTGSLLARTAAVDWAQTATVLAAAMAYFAVLALVALQGGVDTVGLGTRENLRSRALSGQGLPQDLRDADLQGEQLSGLDLSGRDLRGVRAEGASFAGGVLREANLAGAYLRGADLRGADLRESCLRGTDLTGTGLAGADFTGADVDSVTGRPSLTDVIGWGGGPAPEVCEPN